MTSTETLQNIDVTSLFRSAYENRYTWDRNFPGFRAVAALVHGTVTHQAQVIVSSELKVEIINPSSPEAEKAIRDQLQELVIHRIHRGFEAVHGKNEFTLETQDASGEVTILVGGAASGDRYKVHNNIVSMVHRHIHGTVVTINVHSTLDTGKGYLPIDYESFYSNPSTGEDSPKQQHQDEYGAFGDYFILTSRRVSPVGPEGTLQEFRMTEISLLEPTATH